MNKIFAKKFCTIDKKAYLCTRIQPSGVRTLLGLCYGVMAALEFLVLSVQVRILVAQPQKKSVCFYKLTFFVPTRNQKCNLYLPIFEKILLRFKIVLIYLQQTMFI